MISGIEYFYMYLLIIRMSSFENYQKDLGLLVFKFVYYIFNAEIFL